LDGRPDAALSGVGGPVGGTLPSGLSRSQGSEWDIALRRIPSFRLDVKTGVLTLHPLKIPMHLS
jgi:hypothetical protein